MWTARTTRPPVLIDAIAPSSAFDAEAFRQGVELLESRGHRVRFRDDIFDRATFLAGADERRLDELLAALRAPDSDVLWCARGGYGATRLLPSIPPKLVRESRKLLVGFSDVTALHALWWSQGVPSIHGPMVARLATDPRASVERLLRLMETGETTPLDGSGLLPGVAEGRLTGGNLALLAALCGTPWQPDLSGAIVFLEDVGERPYRLDRLFVQCHQAGLFEGVAGLAFGEFNGCGDGVESILAEHAKRVGVPAVIDLPSGHGERNEPLAFGRRVRLDGSTGRLEWLEGLFA